MRKTTLALAHINSAVEELLDLSWWKKWLLGESYNYLLGDCIEMAQFYLEEIEEETENQNEA